MYRVYRVSVGAGFGDIGGQRAANSKVEWEDAGPTQRSGPVRCIVVPLGVCWHRLFFSPKAPLAGFFKLFERRCCGDDDVATVNCVGLS